jgi:hypothetical protein
MTKPDVQRLDQSGTWVKPPGAVRVDVALKGGDGAPVQPRDGTVAITVENIVGANGAELVTRSYAADELPEEAFVTIGQPGGYAVFTTYLAGDTPAE